MEDRKIDYTEQMKKYLEYCEFRKELDWNTLKAYRIDLRQFFEYTLEDIPDKDKIEDYITELHKKYKPKTIKRKIASIKAYYTYLEERDIITNNPFRKKVKFKESVILPRIIPREEIEQLLNYMYLQENKNNEKVYKYWLRDVVVTEPFLLAAQEVAKYLILKQTV